MFLVRWLLAFLLFPAVALADDPPKPCDPGTDTNVCQLALLANEIGQLRVEIAQLTAKTLVTREKPPEPVK